MMKLPKMDSARRKALWSSFTDFWERRGFAVVLLFCACIIGVTAFFGQRMNDREGAGETGAPVPPGSTLPGIMAAGREEPVLNAGAKTEPPAQTPDTSDTVWPAEGEILTGYHADTLIFNETLKEYSTHPALDIAASFGQNVLCAADGVVENVYNDRLLGTTVIVAHENGVLTGYAPLENAPAQGVPVRRGTVLGTVGDDMPGEAEAPAHLHFFITDGEGKPIDPYTFLP